MSQTVITQAFSNWKAQQALDNKPVVLDQFIFALVPGLDVNSPIDNTEPLPPASQIVYRQDVSKLGVVNANAVVYSVTIGADIGDFEFNWIGLVNKASGTLAAIIHAPTQRKVKNDNGQQGNVLTRSILMEYNGAQHETAINVPASTWQIDFTTRLTGMDEAARLTCLDVYGPGAFYGDGFLVAKTGSQYFVTQGLGYIGGLRAILPENENINFKRTAVKVWVDVSYQGTLTSLYHTEINITLATELNDYVLNGIAHYVFAIAYLDAAGNITDLRPKGSLTDRASADFLRKDDNLAALKDKQKSRDNLGLKSAALRDVGIDRGNLLEVGSHGLGADCWYAENPKNIKASGFYKYGGGPQDDLAGWGSVLSSFYGESGYLTQLYISNAENQCRIRFIQNGKVLWSNKLYHEGNKPSAEDVNAYSKQDSDSKYVLKKTTVNGKPLNSNVDLIAADVNAYSKQESEGRYVKQTGDNIAWLDVKDSAKIHGVLEINTADVVWKKGNFDAGNGVRQTNGYRIEGREGSTLYADTFHAERANQHHFFGVSVPNGGANGWFEFRNTGEIVAMGQSASLTLNGDGSLRPDGNIAGSVWGGALNVYIENKVNGRVDWKSFNDGIASRATWESLVDNIKTRVDWGSFNNRSHVGGSRSAWWYKDENTGLIFQGGIVSRQNDKTTVNFPVGYPRECFGVQMTLMQTGDQSGRNVEVNDQGNWGFNAVMFWEEKAAYWWAVGV